MRDRLAPLTAAAIATFLAAFPLAALFDRAFGKDAASDAAFVGYLAALAVLACALFVVLVRYQPARPVLIAAVSVEAVLGAIVLAITAPDDAASYASVVAGLAVLVAAPIAVVWSRAQFAGTVRGRTGLRIAGAAGAAAIAAYLTLAWALFLVDAFVDVATGAGTALAVLAFALTCGAAAYAVWVAPDARAAVAGTLVVAGVPGALGPLLLYALRTTALARPAAAVRADWNEQNALMGVIVVGMLGGVAAVMAIVGSAMLARRRAPS